jgi:predicted nucleic acid-binding protein
MTQLFCDTSVLVAACVKDHPHHNRALPIVSSVAEGAETGAISRHSIAESYSALTTLPLQPKIAPLEAKQLIDTNLLTPFRTIELSVKIYRAALLRCAEIGYRGGVVYDALILECAIAAKSERIFTFKLADFRKLAPELDDRIVAP